MSRPWFRLKLPMTFRMWSELVSNGKIAEVREWVSAVERRINAVVE